MRGLVPGTLLCALALTCAVALAQVSTQPLRSAAATGPATAVAIGGIDRSTAEGGLRALLDGIERGDVAEVAASIALPPSLSITDAQRRLYARRVIVGSQLFWVVEEKFGAVAANRARMLGRLDYVPRVDPAKMTWEISKDHFASDIRASQFAIGRMDGTRPMVSVPMIQPLKDGPWQFHRAAGSSAVILAIQIDDAPWRNGVLNDLARVV
jgi:hypothetical protein